MKRKRRINKPLITITIAFTIYVLTYFYLGELRLPVRTINNDSDQKEAHQFKSAFFEQATRRDPTWAERRFSLKLHNKRSKSYCTAFFIKNTQNKFFVGTHDHCVGFDFETICTDKNLSEQVSFIPATRKTVGFCNRVVAKSEINDFIILELNFPNDQDADLLASIDFLRLSHFQPPLGTALKMLGHPSDPERRTALTVTENCVINQIDSLAYYELTPTEKKQMAAGVESLMKNDHIKTKRRSNLVKAEFLGHNCTTYSGNSGGPMIILGTKAVVGLPAGYFPNIFRKLPSHSSLKFETTNGFIEQTLPTLEKEGIDIIQSI